MSRTGFAIAFLATVFVSACGGADEQRDAGGAAETSPQSPTPRPDYGRQPTGTPIRITIGESELRARLNDTATARDLAAELPLTLDFRDHNTVEKTAPLHRELSLDGAPDGHDPAAGDIGYWAPDGDLVFYYDDDAPFFNGIVRIGAFDGEIDAIRRPMTSARPSNAPNETSHTA